MLDEQEVCLYTIICSWPLAHTLSYLTMMRDGGEHLQIHSQNFSTIIFIFH